MCESRVEADQGVIQSKCVNGVDIIDNAFVQVAFHLHSLSCLGSGVALHVTVEFSFSLVGDLLVAF